MPGLGGGIRDPALGPTRESVSGCDRGGGEIGRDFKIKSYNKVPRSSEGLTTDIVTGWRPMFGRMLPAFSTGSITNYQKVLNI